MTLHEISLKKALNKAYRLVKPKRPDIETFKVNLIKLLGQIDEKESEENVKIHLMDFLKETWYKQEYLVATKGRTDFVIHTGKDAKAPSGGLFGVKRRTNKADMVTRQNLNVKLENRLQQRLKLSSSIHGVRGSVAISWGTTILTSLAPLASACCSNRQTKSPSRSTRNVQAARK